MIHLVRDQLFGGLREIDDPRPFALAAVFAPIAASVAALLWALPLLAPSVAMDGQKLFSTVLVFTLGDMLGVLLLAPPLLWLATLARSGRRPHVPRVAISHWLEIAVVLGAAWLLVGVMREVDFGVVLAPVLQATCWAGLRGGRLAAWIAILLSALIVLPLSSGNVDEVQRLHTHMLLACIVAGGYIAGSYADAQWRSRAEIRRRDRLLLHAQRLKTLRAMSLGVIHEISQPLSTIALEANSLLSASASERPNVPDIRDMADRIARKAADLSELIRRLRRFGEGAGEERSLVSARNVLDDVVKMAATEATNAGVSLERRDGPDAPVSINDIEIRQALLNLVRNAIAASPKPGGTVWLSGFVSNEGVVFSVENRVDGTGSRRSGMGIGLSIAKAVAEGHGGLIGIDHPGPGRVRCTLQLPLAGERR